MATKLIMPKLGLNMVEGLLAEWLKKEGEEVKKGEIIYVVETDKVTNEVEAPEDGVLLHIFVKEGEVVPVRKAVGMLAKPGEQVDLNAVLADDVGQVPAAGVLSAEKPAPAAGSQPQAPATGGQVLASPLVKRMAAEKGIDLAAVVGSGPGGRIMAEDIEKFSARAAAPRGEGALPGRLVPLSGVRKVVAERMALSAQSMAMVTLNSELDVTRLVELRSQQKKAGVNPDEIPGYNAVLVALTARALRQHPYLNASFTGQGIQLYDVAHIGVAVDSPEGLLVVVVRGADQKNAAQIHSELGAMVERALNRKNMPEELKGSTFTITNLGMFGVDSFNPIINPPESGILGIGRFVEKDVLEEGAIRRAHRAIFSLTFDHRVIDGAPAARFLQTLQEHINQYNG